MNEGNLSYLALNTFGSEAESSFWMQSHFPAGRRLVELQLQPQKEPSAVGGMSTQVQAPGTQQVAWQSETEPGIARLFNYA